MLAPSNTLVLAATKTRRSWAPDIVGLFLLVFLAIPLPVQTHTLVALYESGLDRGWMYAIHDALLHGRHFGTDIVFTYGPLGMMAAPIYYPPSFRLLMALNTAFLLIFGAVWLRHWRELQINRWVWICACVALAVAIELRGEVLALTAPLLLLAIHAQCRRRRPYPWGRVLALAGLAGICVLMKATLWISVLLIVGYVSADLLFLGLFPWPLPVSALCMVLAWAAARQPLGNLPAYFKESWQIIDGFREMAVGLESGHLQFVITALLAAALQLLGLWRALRMTGTRRFSACTVLVAAALVFLFCKQGLVRADLFHLGNMALFLGVFALFLYPLMQRIGTRIQWAGAVCLFFSLGAVEFWSELAFLPGQLNWRAQALVQTPRNHTGEQWIYDHVQQETAANYALGDISGTIDAYGSLQAPILLEGLHYQPRPVFQSYAAYTPELARLNRAFLESPRAPDHLLFAPQPIDHHYPSLEDGLSWPLILANYDPRERAVGEALLLDRRLHSRMLTTTPLFTVTAQLNEPVEIAPSGAIIWAKITAPPTMPGKLAGLLYQEPELDIEVDTPAGNARRFRLLPSVIGEGFLLSPLVADSQQFRRLYQSLDGAGAGGFEDVRRFRLIGGRLNSAHYAIELFVLGAS